MESKPIDPTFDLLLGLDNEPAIRCRLCGSVSDGRDNVGMRYCTRCHVLHDTVAEARLAVSQGARTSARNG
jgi:hypothetical protein